MILHFNLNTSHLHSIILKPLVNLKLAAPVKQTTFRLDSLPFRIRRILCHLRVRFKNNLRENRASLTTRLKMA